MTVTMNMAMTMAICPQPITHQFSIIAIIVVIIQRQPQHGYQIIIIVGSSNSYNKKQWIDIRPSSSLSLAAAE